MDSNTIFDVSLWSHQMFGSCRLGDARRTQRAVAVGASMAMAPERSLLQQSEGAWASAKATYRLLNTEEIDPAELWRPQQQQTLDDASSQRGVVLFIQDTTELDYSAFESTEGLGYIGNSSRVGFLAQHTLAVLPAARPQEARILGLAMQRLWRREESSHGRESRSQRVARWRESDVWYETLEAIGPVPAEQQWISVGDRASDVYSYMRRSEELSWGFLLRVTQNRCMTTVDGQKAYLKTYMRSLSAGFTRELHDGTTLQVAYARVSVQPPTLYTAKGSPAIEAWAIRCWGETSQGKEIEWILLSNQPLEDHQAVSEAISWYEHRWLIEEYHKCLKTGCRVEHRGLKQADSLQRMIAMMAVVAVRLLSLRNTARTAGEQPAIAQVNPALVQLLIVRLSLQTDPQAMTLYEFYRALARLGGFLGRKSDGEPGWQTLWLGWHRLNDMWQGAQILNQSG